MQLNWRQTDDGAVVIDVEGELDLVTAPQLRELLVEAIEGDSRAVTTLDLAKCTFVDSTVIGVIVEAGRLLDRRVQRLRIANLRDQPKRLFELTLVERASFIEIVNEAPIS